MSQSPVIIKSHEYEVLSTKSEFVYDADIRQALHQDGNWYLIPTKYCYQYLERPQPSMLFHICAKSWVCKSSPDERGVEGMSVYPYTLHRMNQSEMGYKCEHCHELPPEGLVGVWTLHNWDYLSEKDHDA
jgi:hypothetical protein